MQTYSPIVSFKLNIIQLARQVQWMILMSFITFFCIQNVYSQQNSPEQGKASYYADKFNGRRTASGDIFDNQKLTAAHRKFEFGTKLKVTNIKNGKSVVVLINDRGPYAHGRIIDLSKQAAQQLDFIKEGVADVLIEKIESTDKLDNTSKGVQMKEGEVRSIWGTTRNVTTFGIQIASYNSWDNALEHAKDIKVRGVELPLIQFYTEKSKVYYRVMAGDFVRREDAEKYLKELNRKKIKGFIKTY